MGPPIYFVKAAAPYLDAIASSIPPSIDPFAITMERGFMPLHTPLAKLPSAFQTVEDLLHAMPVVQKDGHPGLLATYSFGKVINAGTLPDLTMEVDKVVLADGKPDLLSVTALFRDYSFIASAYLLEPCWETWCHHREGYGLGRPVLPRCIAGPLVKCAQLLDIPPFMSYAAAYTLYNYTFADDTVGHEEYANLRLVRAFEKGLDHTSSEAGFILTHVDMVKHSSGLVQGAVHLLNAAACHAGPVEASHALDLLLSTMSKVEHSMETMWAHSKPKDYISYRTFIFGITNQSMFPNGVIYEGENEGMPMSFRGESGANDSMIPLLDALLQIPMPTNPLTEILKDFRNYRPKPHRDFLAAVRAEADLLGVRDYCCKDPETTLSYLKLLDHVRSFRWRHWLFAREYIIRRTTHATATGGSPIVTWLPNQLSAVMDLMSAVWNAAPEDTKIRAAEMMHVVSEQREKLTREVEMWCKERGV